MRFRLISGAAVALGLGFATLAPGSASAHDLDEAARSLRFSYIKCYETEDNGNDEIYLYIYSPNGTMRRVWSPARPRTFWKGRGMPMAISVKRGDTIQVYERDAPDGDDWLGTIYVRDGDFWYRFDNGALYRIHVKPV